jgi:prepilin-type N-terminal cleavage/methylation domain-containing protein
MKKIRISKKGFTLTEIVLVVAIIVILSAASFIGVTATINSAKNSQQKLQTHSDTFENVAWKQVKSITAGAVNELTAPEYTPNIEEAEKQMKQKTSDLYQKSINTWKKQGYADEDIIITKDDDGYITDAKLAKDAKPNKTTTTVTTTTTTTTTDTVADATGGGAPATNDPKPNDPKPNDPKPNNPQPNNPQPNNPKPATNTSGSYSGSSSGSVTQTGYQGNATIKSVTGNPIQSVTIYAPEGVTISGINYYNNNGMYNSIDISDDNRTVTVSFTADWTGPLTTLNLYNIQWSGSQNLDYTYDIVYAN